MKISIMNTAYNCTPSPGVTNGKDDEDANVLTNVGWIIATNKGRRNT